MSKLPRYRSNGNNPTFKVPRNKQAREVFYKEYGKLVAQDVFWERKAANFGKIFSQDRFSSLTRICDKEGFKNKSRAAIYKKSMDLYENDELVRPIINLISTSIFSKEAGGLDIRGTNKNLKTLVEQIVDHNELNFHQLAAEGELAGDVFLWMQPDGDKSEIWSLDAGKTKVILEGDDIRRKLGYTQADGSEESFLAKDVEFPLERTQHLKFNSTTTSLYGRSSLRHLYYWLDVKDRLFEDNALRGAQYYGNPDLFIMGVPGPYQETIRTQLQSQTKRGGRAYILPPDSKVEVPDYSLGYPILDVVGWVFRMISIGSEIPITLLGTADAGSRGSAFFSNPRFTLAIRQRREVWRIGLRAFFIKLFKAIGEVPENESPTRKEFDLGFLPIFDKDARDLADLVEILRTDKIISKKTVREWFGADHSDEREFLEDEEANEPEKAPLAPVGPDGMPVSQPQPNKPTPKQAREQRKKRRLKREE